MTSDPQCTALKFRAPLDGYMNEEADIEALQAQIELSTSVAYDIVSSWMKPTLQTSKESISDTISRELEEFAKRPHR